MFGRDLGQYFAVEFHLSDFQLMDELAVGQTVQAGGGVDADLPERPELSFLQSAVLIGMTAGAGDGRFGFADLILPAPLVPFSGLQNITAVFNVGDSALDSHGIKKLSGVW